MFKLEDYEEIEQYSCVMCHSIFGRMFRNRKTNDHVCENCKKTFKTPSGLTRHVCKGKSQGNKE